MVLLEGFGAVKRNERGEMREAAATAGPRARLMGYEDGLTGRNKSCNANAMKDDDIKRTKMEEWGLRVRGGWDAEIV